jgi:dipeptidyl aminopeptidase/acylaminoacyl peptidase
MADRTIEPMDEFETGLSRQLRELSVVALRSVDPHEVAAGVVGHPSRSTHRSWPSGRLVFVLLTIGVLVALLVAIATVGRTPRPLPQLVERPPAVLPRVNPSLPLPPPTERPPASLPRLGHLAYASAGAIYVANADGSDPVRVTNPRTDGRGYRAPRWAGSVLTFIGPSAEDLRTTVFALDRIDGTPRPVGRVWPGQGGPQKYSPDGHRFALLTHGSLTLVDGDGGSVRVTPPPGFQSWDHSDRQTFAWLPDGSALLVSACTINDCTRDGDTAVFLVSGDGNVTRQLSTPYEPIWAAQVSPDGSRIAFMTCAVLDGICQVGDDGPRLGFADIDGSDRVIVDALAGQRTSFWGPRWSADGTHVFAIAGPLGEHSAIAIIDADGRQVPKVIGHDEQPLAWTPDGTGILAFAYEHDRFGRLELLATDGTEVHTLVKEVDYGEADLEWVTGSGADPFDEPAP